MIALTKEVQKYQQTFNEGLRQLNSHVFWNASSSIQFRMPLLLFVLPPERFDKDYQSTQAYKIGQRKGVSQVNLSMILPFLSAFSQTLSS